MMEVGGEGGRGGGGGWERLGNFQFAGIFLHSMLIFFSHLTLYEDTL